MHCILEAYYMILQNPMTEKYNNFQRKDQNTPQTKHRKKLMSSKRFNNCAFLADFRPYRYEVNEWSHFLQKNPKSFHSWSNHFWNPIANVPVKVQYRKKIQTKPETQPKRNSF